jgi:hypothetical protein
MKLARLVFAGAAILVLAPAMAPAEEGPETKPPKDPGPQVRLEVVMTRSQGDTVIARLPYTLLLSAGGSGARVYGGIQLPILVRHEGSNTMMFKNAGGNVFARTWALEGGRFKVDLTTEYGGVYPTNGESATEEPDVSPAAPVLRSFSSNATITLGDGQSTVFSDSADPITGETVKTEVTLHVVK